jgi:hypothetical protein
MSSIFFKSFFGTPALGRIGEQHLSIYLTDIGVIIGGNAILRDRLPYDKSLLMACSLGRIDI